MYWEINIWKFIDLVKYLFLYCYWCFWWFGAIERLEIMVIFHSLCICLKVMKDDLLVFYTMQTNIWKKVCISWIFQSCNIVLICGHLPLVHLWSCGMEKPGTIIYYTAIVELFIVITLKFRIWKYCLFHMDIHFIMTPDL